MSKSVDVILGAVKAAGEAALRLHEENKALAAQLAAAERALKIQQAVNDLAYRPHQILSEQNDRLRERLAYVDALREAAGRVTCARCYSQKKSCPDCADLRRLLERKE